MPRLQLVIFDCDGVMFDSLDANRAYYNHILAHFGHPPMDDEALQYVHVRHVADSVRFIFRHYPADYEAAEAYRLTLDYSPYLKFMRMEPDLVTFLQFLRPDHRIGDRELIFQGEEHHALGRTGPLTHQNHPRHGDQSAIPRLLQRLVVGHPLQIAPCTEE